MSTYQELLARREALDAQIEACVAGRAAAIQQIRDLLNDYGLTIQEVMAEPAVRQPGRAA
ncbi:hypothetical protein GCM10027081_18330 [Cupriavidus yeoncheonensis]